jgi:hypothetical protein
MRPGAAIALPVCLHTDENFHRARHCPAFSHEKNVVRTGGKPLRARFPAFLPTHLLQRGNNAVPFHFFC